MHFYFILHYHLVSNWRETLFEVSVDKQHWKHSISDKYLVFFDVLKLLLNLQ